MLAIQQYLRSGNTLASLSEKQIKLRRSNKHPNLVLLKYDIFADFNDPIVRECRGIILDEADNWKVVSLSFFKFFNHGESHAASIDWSTARVQEKLDGSLCVMYHYDGEWHVATSGSPDASGLVQQAGAHIDIAFGDRSFADYFWQTFKAEGGVLPPEDVNDVCFVFELMGPANRVVVVHDCEWLRLLAMRDRVTGTEFNIEEHWGLVNIAPVRSFPLDSVDDIVKSFERISPVSQEGYIVVDGKQDRIKIKHPGYVALHHAKDGMGPKAFAEIARTGEVSEVVAAFPEFKHLLDEAHAKHKGFIERCQTEYDRIKHISAQKDFALEALKTPCATALFQLRKGRELRELMKSVTIDTYMSWVNT